MEKCATSNSLRVLYKLYEYEGMKVEPWSLQTLLSSESLEFEQKLLKNPKDLDIWIKYVESSKLYRQKVFIYERLVKEFSDEAGQERIQQHWKNYLNLVRDHMIGLNFYHHRAQFQAMNKLYQRYLVRYNDPPDLEIWGQYLKFLNLQANVKFILQEYHFCFMSLEISDHLRVWPIFLQFADTIALYDEQLATDILLKFIEYGTFDISHLTKLLQWKQETGISTVKTLLLDDINQKFSEDHWKMIMLYLKDEVIAKAFLKKFPNDFSFGNINLIESVGDNFSLKKHLFVKALKDCPTVTDFTNIYEVYLNFLESKLDEEDPSDYDISEYEKLLKDREIMINNIYLKDKRDNLDFWFERFAIYENENDMNGLLKTFVEAISLINPLKCISHENHRLSEIWIKYASIYSDKGDLNTANLIYSKSTQSKFKSIEELVDIYINWSNIFVNNDQLSQGIEVLEKVLFDNLEISRSTKLWLHYFEIMEIHFDDIDKIIASYYKMIELKYVTPLIIFNFANFLQDENKWEEAFSIYEIGLREFKDDEIRFEIYNNYITKMLMYKETQGEVNGDAGNERVRDLFDKSLRELPKSALVKPIVILYSEFEFNNGLVLRGAKIMTDFISSLKEDPCDLIFILIDKFKHPQYENDLRNWLTNWIELTTLTKKSFIKLMVYFIDFEISHNQFTRVRSLFKHLHLNAVYSFEHWQDFELEFGDESTFKAMLRFKKTVAEDTDKHIPVPSDRGIGFVKGTKTNTKDTHNPDEIDVDM